MKIGVTGPHGRLGSTLVALGCDPLECDITIEEQVKDAIHSVKPDVIINCAAYTSVDGAELPENSKRMIATNLSSLRLLYAYLGTGHLIHISTDYVFGGKRGPYTEKSMFIPSDLPVNEYGKSKMAAESFLCFLPDVTIVRTTGLFGVGSDFVEFLLQEVGNRGTSVTVVNTVSNQTYIPFLANDLIQLAHTKLPPRLLHLASCDMMNRFEFAKKIIEGSDLPTDRLLPEYSSNLSWWKAKRPVHCGLNTKLSKKLGFKQYTVEDGIKAYFDKDNDGHSVLQSL